jgi:hypothetical protein
VALKGQLVLTADEAFTAAQRAAEKKKKQVQKGRKQGRKRKAKEVESESEDNSSGVDTDPVVPPEVLECIVVQ